MPGSYTGSQQKAESVKASQGKTGDQTGPEASRVSTREIEEHNTWRQGVQEAED